jgi:cation:H+ antiporter
MLSIDFSVLLAALLVILAGAEFFTNALEHAGQRLSLSEGLTGSVFAAVATALPETLVPLVAVFFGGAASSVRGQIGIGAILGAPLMLVSVTIALMALFAGIKRGWHVHLKPEISGFLRDLMYFLAAFLIALLSLFVPVHQSMPRIMASVLLVFLYFMYVINTVRASKMLVLQGHVTRAEHILLLKRLGIPHSLWSEIAQLVLGLVFIIAGAKMFVYGVEQLAQITRINVLVISLLIVPVATEMPEKINSILWIRRGKDTLAFGNITGALVFQGCLLTAFGIQLSAWRPQGDILLSMGFTFAAALFLLILCLRRQLTPGWLIASGLAYVLVSFLTV